MATLKVTAGRTMPIPLRLYLNNAPLDLSGYTLTAMLRQRDTTVYVDTTGDVAADADQASLSTRGICYWSPDSTDLVATIPRTSTAPDLYLRIKAVDGVGRVAHYPEGDPVSVYVMAP